MNKPEHVFLYRRATTDQGTIGVLRHQFFGCDTLELPWRDNRRNESCIPATNYRCFWHESPSKGWCFKLVGVTDRSHILIHRGNWAGDKSKGFVSNSDGCILLGEQPAKLQRQLAIVNSRNALDAFHEHMQQKEFTLIIKDPAGVIQ
jgi:hypothetical protein